MNFLPGTQLLTTTDAVVGVSGKPVRVFSAAVLSDGTASTVVLRNGTTTGGDAYIELDGVINKLSTPFNSLHGVLFPNGCFADTDAHSVGGYVSFTMEL
jgi:hypothetical protein